MRGYWGSLTAHQRRVCIVGTRNYVIGFVVEATIDRIQVGQGHGQGPMIEGLEGVRKGITGAVHLTVLTGVFYGTACVIALITNVTIYIATSVIHVSTTATAPCIELCEVVVWCESCDQAIRIVGTHPYWLK